MGLFETLRLEHAAIQDLLDEVIDPTGMDPGVALAELQAMLLVHDKAEEAVFYDALRTIPYRTELAEIQTEEHHVIETLITELLNARPGKSTWTAKLSLLKSQLESHIAEEETNVFAAAEVLIDDEMNDRLGRSFEALRESFWEEQVAIGRSKNLPLQHPLTSAKIKGVYKSGIKPSAGHQSSHQAGHQRVIK